MPDREKVIKGLECCLGAQDSDVEPNKDCPYNGMCLCAMALHFDVMELLKEQEQKTGYWVKEELNSYTTDNYCSVCKGKAPFIHVADDHYGIYSHGETLYTKFCPHCGAKMEEIGS